MLLDTKRARDKNTKELMNYFRVVFDSDEVRYLADGLKGSQPKLKYSGTISEGLILYFDSTGTGLRYKDDGGREVLINSAWVGGYQGDRPPCQPSYDRGLHSGRPAIMMYPIQSYDRDADKVERVEAANELFNPVIPAPAPETATAAAKQLTKDKVAEIAAKYSAPGAPAQKPPQKPPPLDVRGSVPLKDRLPPAQAGVKPITKANGGLVTTMIPKQPATEKVVLDLRELISMINETVSQSDNILLRVDGDGRHLRAVRLQVSEEVI